MKPSVERAALVVHGATRSVEGARSRLEAAAAASSVELELAEEAPEGFDPDLCVALGGDGTMLRALTRFLGSGVPVIGVNLGRVGFLASISAAELEPGIARAFAGDYAVVELPTLEVAAGATAATAVNDVVVVSGIPGRIVDLAYSLDGDALGVQACDGLICATPAGSTAYNLSNGGPVLVWGLEAAVVTFVAPHTLRARPLVVGPEFSLSARNETPDVPAFVLIDGHQVATLGCGETVTVGMGAERSLLATLPEQAFFARYARVFAGA